MAIEKVPIEEVPRDCYFCKKAPRVYLGKPRCTFRNENIEPDYTGSGAYHGWTCEADAKNCNQFVPKDNIIRLVDE